MSAKSRTKVSLRPYYLIILPYFAFESTLEDLHFTFHHVHVCDCDHDHDNNHDYGQVFLPFTHLYSHMLHDQK